MVCCRRSYWTTQPLCGRWDDWCVPDSNIIALTCGTTGACLAPTSSRSPLGRLVRAWFQHHRAHLLYRILVPLSSALEHQLPLSVQTVRPLKHGPRWWWWWWWRHCTVALCLSHSPTLLQCTNTANTLYRLPLLIDRLTALQWINGSLILLFCWYELFTGRMPFLSHNQQCQRTEINT